MRVYGKIALLLGALAITTSIAAKEISIEPGPDAQERLQEAMILMQEGDTVIIQSGYYSFEDGLSLDVDGVTIKGAGIDKTVLDFKHQKSGSRPASDLR